MFTASAEKKKKTEHGSATPDQGVVLKHLGRMPEDPSPRTLHLLCLWALNTSKEPLSMLKFLKPLWVLLLPLYKGAHGAGRRSRAEHPLCQGPKHLCTLLSRSAPRILKPQEIFILPTAGVWFLPATLTNTFL